ncbi:MAG: 4-hydroxy-tetrahydrodipicolinate synthase [Eubacteriales bacterium]
MKPSVFTGVATAMITPFRGGGIDYESLSALIDFQIANKTDALVIAGTTGEASTLTDEEYSDLIRFAVEKTDGRVPVIAGSGSNCTEKACRLSRIASDAGADACLVVTPYYNKATQRGLAESYRHIAACGKPIILYNVPSRTGMRISIDTYEELSKVENIVAVKEADTDISNTAELIFRCGDALDIYTGNDSELIPVLALGGAGVISVASNLIPSEMRSICRSFLGGNCAEARRSFAAVFPLIRALFSEVNPIPVKTALSMRGFCEEEFRLPLCSMEEQRKEALGALLYRYFQPANG